ncbi:hypothetical protein VTL71DRAFT_2111 [Oculimacula yallundae]|uniref:Uncharacterized protein n=1 Tax=Oculimacula yallundae TaxID=86028 RepID=A0ABR4C8H6_9HELO
MEQIKDEGCDDNETKPVTDSNDTEVASEVDFNEILGRVARQTEMLQEMYWSQLQRSSQNETSDQGAQIPGAFMASLTPNDQFQQSMTMMNHPQMMAPQGNQGSYGPNPYMPLFNRSTPFGGPPAQTHMWQYHGPMQSQPSHMIQGMPLSAPNMGYFQQAPIWEAQQGGGTWGRGQGQGRGRGITRGVAPPLGGQPLFRGQLGQQIDQAAPIVSTQTRGQGGRGVMRGSVPPARGQLSNRGQPALRGDSLQRGQSRQSGSQRHSPGHFRVAPRSLSHPDDPCCQCGSNSHQLKHHPNPNTPRGYLQGCPHCNRLDHTLAMCPYHDDFKENEWYYLRECRTGLCPVEDFRDFRAIHRISPNNEIEYSLEMHLPLTPEFALASQYPDEFSFQHPLEGGQLDLQEDPFWTSANPLIPLANLGHFGVANAPARNGVRRYWEMFRGTRHDEFLRLISARIRRPDNNEASTAPLEDLPAEVANFDSTNASVARLSRSIPYRNLPSISAISPSQHQSSRSSSGTKRQPSSSTDPSSQNIGGNESYQASSIKREHKRSSDTNASESNTSTPSTKAFLDGSLVKPYKQENTKDQRNHSSTPVSRKRARERSSSIHSAGSDDSVWSTTALAGGSPGRNRNSKKARYDDVTDASSGHTPARPGSRPIRNSRMTIEDVNGSSQDFSKDGVEAYGGRELSLLTPHMYWKGSFCLACEWDTPLGDLPAAKNYIFLYWSGVCHFVKNLVMYYTSFLVEAV